MTGRDRTAHRTREIVRHDDVQIEVIVEGDGQAVVMLPSSGRDSEDFNDVAAGIASAGFRVLRPQPRGIGSSEGPMENISLHDFARDMAAVITALADTRAAMVGHAFGNQIARMTAVDHPALVAGVVLAAAAAKGPSPQELRQALRKSADTSLPDSERLPALQFAFFAPDHDASPWLRGWHPRAMQAQQVAIGNTAQDEWWSAGSAPILDLQAGSDPWRPRATKYELKMELGDRVTVVEIADASHALIPEQPAAVVNGIVGWARRG